MPTSRPVRWFAVPLLLAALVLPAGASAASSRLSCTLTVRAGDVRETVRGKETVLVPAHAPVEIAWSSRDARSATDYRGESVKSSGSVTVTPDRSRSYSFTFKNGSKKETCTAELVVAEGSFASAALATDSAKPTLSGTADGVRQVQVIVREAGSARKAYTSKDVSVKRGKWSAKIGKTLPKGAYDITLVGPKDTGRTVLATDTLFIGGGSVGSAGKADTTLVVSLVPLLGGGTARAGASVPVSYLQITNTGKKEATLTGFMLRQNGTAPASVIAGLATVDDKGLIRAGTTGPISWKGGVATAPTNATFAPGQMRLFTVRTVLAADALSSIGKNLMVDIAGIETNAKVSGTFPIRGTTWTIGY